MTLFDLHCHSSGISLCSRISYDKVVDSAKEAGFKGIVLTNHYCEDYLQSISIDEWIEKYIQEYELAKTYGESVNMKVLFAVEVTMNFDKRVHMLIYGITPELLRRHKPLYDKSLEELYEFCSKYDLTLIQAHPYRYGSTVLDTRYLDGIEINCHPKYGNTYSADIIEIATQKGLAVTCGCDFHGDVDYRPRGGMFVPDHISDGIALAKYLKETKEFTLQVHEIGEELPTIKKIVINK